MKKYFKDRFQLTDNGAEGLIKAIRACFFVNLVSMIPVIILMIIGDILLLNNYHRINLIVISSIITLIILFISLYIEYGRMFITTYSESANLRINLANKLKELPLSYFSKTDLTDLSQSIMSDVEAVEHAISHALPKVYSLYIFLPIMALILIIGNVELGLAVVVPNVIRFIVLYIFKKETNNKNKNFYGILRENSEKFQETIEMNREIKGFNLTEKVKKSLYLQMEYSEKEHLKAELTNMKTLLVSNIFSYISMVIVLFIGSKLMLASEINIVYLMGYLLASIKIKEIIDISTENFLEILYIDPRVERIKEINSQIIQVGEKADIENFNIDLENVNFSYNKDIKVIDNVTFTAKQGEVTALVGESGCGKSTLLKLISRLYDYNTGQILIENKDIKSISTDSLFSKISIVFQDVTLFNTTVMENIRIGRLDANDEEVIEAAKMANCMDFISKLPKGFYSQIGENGSELSGGERQRLSIARAFLKKAPVLILDEISANLDVENERKIQTSLNKLIKDTTVIVISHRMKSIENVDKIIVMKNGKVEASGTHKELMEKSKTYRKLNENSIKAEKFIY